MPNCLNKCTWRFLFWEFPYKVRRTGQYHICDCCHEKQTWVDKLGWVFVRKNELGKTVFTKVEGD